MIYSTLRWIAGIALHWFYGDIRVVGQEKIPRDAPLLIAVNHPNALVDSLVVGWLMPRRVVMTAKATLLNNPFVAALFRVLGVVSLRRASDELRAKDGGATNPARNYGAFEEMLHVLAGKGAVLIFPEGTSHSNSCSAIRAKPDLSGASSLARDNAHIAAVHIVPIGSSVREQGNSRKHCRSTSRRAHRHGPVASRERSHYAHRRTDEETESRC